MDQAPEELVAIPDGWGVITHALEDSISLSQQYCTFLHTHVRIQPLGHVLYTGADAHRGIGFPREHLHYKSYEQLVSEGVVTSAEEKKKQCKRVPSFD